MLIKALLANAGFSALCALVMLGFSASLGEHIPLREGDWTGLATGLLLFVGVLIFLVMHKTQAIKHAMSIIVGDVLWVIGASVLSLMYMEQLSGLGVVLVVVVNLFVAGFAVAQYLGLRQTDRSATN